MDALIDKAQRLSGHIIRAGDNLKKIGQARLTLGVMEAKIAVIDGKWQEFTAVNDRIEAEATAADRNRPYFTEDVQSSTEMHYLMNKGNFLDMIRRYKGDEAQPQQASAPVAQQLPRLNLPKFSGVFSEWPSFRDLFSSMVGDSKVLTPIEKLQHLKTSLSKEPAAIIASLPLTAENLDAAWRALVNRYENKRLLVSAQVANIFALQPMKSESSSELRALFNGTVNALAALRSLGRPVDGYDDLLIHITVHKLDKQSRREWGSAMSSIKDPPSFADLRSFLEARICAMEELEQDVSPDSSSRSSIPAENQKKTESKSKSGNKVKSHQASITNPAPKKCAFCEEEHTIVACEAFRAKTVDERKAFALSANLCLNCLGTHYIRDCKSQKTCQVCRAKHNTLIHGAHAGSSAASVTTTPGPRSTNLAQRSSQDQPNTSTSSNTAALAVNASRTNSTSRVLLATAIVRVHTASGEPLVVRALLDQGSEASFIAESLAQRLRLPRTSASVAITGIGARAAATSRGRVSLVVSSRLESEFKLTVNALVLPRLTAYLPPKSVAGVNWPHLDGLEMADPDLASLHRVELLLGAEAFSQILLPGVYKGPIGAPIAQNTYLGWILSGLVGSRQGVNHPCSSFQVSVDYTLDSALQRFWEQEEIASPTLPLTQAEEECEKHFRATYSRDTDGRYVVRLPLKTQVKTLGNSYSAASRMLARMEQRCARDTTFATAYSAFMGEYEQLNHMQLVASSQPEPSLAYYLPHHGVIRESSETTKFRVVFNGSQKTATGTSLNDHLHIGPKLLPDLVDILLRWRTHAVVFSADMEKMYRQVLVHPCDRDLQRILWRTSPGAKPDVYRLRTVTYGLACAPYLAIRAVQQLARDERERFPLGSQALLSDVYVDDVLSGSDTVEDALSKQRELIELLKAGGFALRKWTSNSRALLSHLPASVLATGKTFDTTTESSFHMLGLSWAAEGDTFVFRLKNPRPNQLPLTKRKILSIIAELFDPLGLLAPVTVRAKIFMQSLWLLKLGWDEPIPEVEALNWTTFYDDLPRISDCRISRWLNVLATSQSLELHGFADASERAFAAVVYLCVDNGNREVALVAAKSKVAPIKQVSLPRLELCAAQLLAKLVKHVRGVLARECAVFLWSDSTVTLAWIRGHPTRWKTYVANRVSEIQRTLPDATWHHVESRQNPADCASRGLLASELTHHALWWTGPQWLTASSASWPIERTNEPKDPPEQRVLSHAATQEPDEPSDLLSRYSTLLRLQRITAWLLRFKDNAQHRSNGGKKRQLASILLPTELSSALTSLIRVEQSRLLQTEIRALKAGSPTKKGSLLQLNPFLDHDGVLRVGGRLSHALLDADERHPIIVPRASPLTTLLVDHVHRQTLHGGMQLTLATLRQRFWIVSARSTVKTFIGRCVRCLRFRAATASQLMGSLPRERVTRARPFYHAGVDYAGPIAIRMSKGRGYKAAKAYIAVFVCFATRAVHLEAVTDYSTDGFLAAYKRFTSRRGLCLSLSSDCGTNFVGADAELRALFSSASAASEKIRAALANDGVEWKFNPPSAPHFGGLWEAAVKSVKHHLRRVIGDTTLTYEEISTLLAQIEACLNSRPLQALTDDPADLNALTPGHFLIGAPLSAIPEPSLVDLPSSRLSRWQLVQQMRDSFWGRWASEYLHQLQARPKWKQPQEPLRVGDLVLIKNELNPPTKWPLARVTATHPGDDGHIRVATVKTASSSFKRPIVKLCVLLRATDSDASHS